MRTFACVLKKGGDYNAKHVRILQNQVMRAMPSTDRFVCLTDLPSIKGVETMQLELGLRGKYSMMEVFRITGEVVVTGLDTILMGDLDKIWDVSHQTKENTFWMIKSFNKNRQYGNGIMIWNGDWSRLMYNYDPKISLTYSLEQEYTIWKLKQEKADIQVVNDHFNIKSYKHLHKKNKKPPTKNMFLIFHGNPRPHQVSTLWVKELYQ